jgi:hypothetical protein
MSYIDSLIKKFRKKRPELVQQYINEFYNQHGFYDEELRKRLDKEADRLYPMVDESIANAQGKIAKKTTLISVAGIVGVGLLLILFMGLPVYSIIFALAAAAFVYKGKIDTIKEAYHGRIKGGLRSVTEIYEKELADKAKAPEKPVEPIKPVQEKWRERLKDQQKTPLSHVALLKKQNPVERVV